MRIPYRYRGLSMLSALLVLLPAAAWRYALHDTVRTAIECRRLRVSAADVSDMPPEPQSVPARMNDILLSGRLLDHVAGDVRVVGYTPVVTDCQGALAVHTAELTLTGTFAELLHVLHRIECEVPECVIRSVSWSLAADRTARTELLMLTLYVQQLVKTEK